MATNKLKIGDLIPHFENLRGVDGKIYSSREFFNTDENISALIIIFSCNHCPYVKAYEDRIISIQKDYYESGVRIVAINSNDDVNYPEDSFDEMIKRSTQKNFNFIYLRDATQEVAKNFGATHTPEIFLFGKNQKLVYHGKIDDNWQNPDDVKVPYLRIALDEYLSGKEIQFPETYSIGCTIKWKQ
jgi:thiol-disulfide isomerase/thioredoxin